MSINNCVWNDINAMHAKQASRNPTKRPPERCSGWTDNSTKLPEQRRIQLDWVSTRRYSLLESLPTTKAQWTVLWSHWAWACDLCTVPCSPFTADVTMLPAKLHSNIILGCQQHATTIQASIKFISVPIIQLLSSFWPVCIRSARFVNPSLEQARSILWSCSPMSKVTTYLYITYDVSYDPFAGTPINLDATMLPLATSKTWCNKYLFL